MSKAHVKNILRIFDNATDGEKADGIRWYNDANEICQRLSRKHNIDLELVCYVMAALSPNNRWQRNIIDTETIVRMFAEGELTPLVSDYRNGNKDALKGLASTYTTNLLKAFDILNTKDVSYIGKGLKTNNFAKNILHSDDDNITVDYHAVSVAINFRHTTDSLKVTSFRPKQYHEIANAYKEAGRQRGILGKQMQAVCWVAWRNLDKK